MADPTAVSEVRPSPSPGAERRKFFRYVPGLETRGHLIADVGGDFWPVDIRNISAGGVSLVFDRRVEAETRLTIRLYNTARNFFSQLPIRVLYSVAHPGGEYILGCAFTRELSADEVQGLL